MAARRPAWAACPASAAPAASSPSSPTPPISCRACRPGPTASTCATSSAARPSSCRAQPSDGAFGAHAPSLSDDGRLVAFTGVGTSSGGPADEVFVADLADGSVVQASRTVGNSPPTGQATTPLLRADGSEVVFASDAPDILGQPAARHVEPLRRAHRRPRERTRRRAGSPVEVRAAHAVPCPRHPQRHRRSHGQAGRRVHGHRAGRRCRDGAGQRLGGGPQRHRDPGGHAVASSRCSRVARRGRSSSNLNLDQARPDDPEPRRGHPAEPTAPSASTPTAARTCSPTCSATSSTPTTRPTVATWPSRRPASSTPATASVRRLGKVPAGATVNVAVAGHGGVPAHRGERGGAQRHRHRGRKPRLRHRVPARGALAERVRTSTSTARPDDPEPRHGADRARRLDRPVQLRRHAPHRRRRGLLHRRHGGVVVERPLRADHARCGWWTPATRSPARPAKAPSPVCG